MEYLLPYLRKRTSPAGESFPTQKSPNQDTAPYPGFELERLGSLDATRLRVPTPARRSFGDDLSLVADEAKRTRQDVSGYGN